MANEHTNKVSTALIWFATLLNTTNLTVVIPTVNKCSVGPPALAGLMVGLFPLSKAIMNGPSTIFIERFSIKAFFLGVCAFQFIGNILYAIAPATGTIGGYVLSLTGRFLVGAFGGQLLNGSFVARGFPTETRSSAMLLMQSAQATAYVLGPLLGGLLELLCATMGWNDSLLNGCTAPGWFMSMLALLLFIGAGFWFEEPPQVAKQSKADRMETGTTFAPEEAMPWGRLAVAYLMVFLVQSTIGSWELHTADMAEHSWGWKQSEAGFYLAGCMVLAIPSLLFGSKITSLLTDRNAICLMLSCLAPFAMLLLPFILGPSDQKARQIVLYSTGSMGFTIFALVAAGLTKSLITKMTPIPFRQKAVGIMATASALGRTFGPILATSSDAVHVGGYAIFALVLLLLATVVLGFQALRPYEYVEGTEGSKKIDLDSHNASTSGICQGVDVTGCSASDSRPEQECQLDDGSARTFEDSQDNVSDDRCASDSDCGVSHATEHA